MLDLERLLSHDAGPLVQFIKYALAGGVATAVHIAIFHLAGWRLFPCLQARDILVRWLRIESPAVDQRRRARNSMLANGTAFLLSNLVAYLLNIWFVFQGGRHVWYVEVLSFYAVSAISMVIGSTLMGWLIRRYGLLTTFAFGANLVTALLINFAVRKYFIFGG